MMRWLEGRKEIIITTTAGAALLLASAGIAPKAVAVLHAIAEAARSGDASVALPAFSAGVVALARAAWRARQNRRDRREAARMEAIETEIRSSAFAATDPRRGA